ncbi:MAG TPA: hypothetical protein VE090_06315 [Methylomirabilota bacterium]|nr:hypothetical protein [Methylomirabilota bacterium]
MMIRFLIGFFVFSLFLGFSAQLAQAAMMTNPHYTIENQDINILPFQTIPTKTPTQPPFMPPPLATGENYTVETNQPEGLSFSISEELIDLGKLTATNPVIRKTSLTTKSAYGYRIEATEDHPLLLDTKTAIPDTTCDNGSCSELTDALWTDTLTYGFGYHTSAMADDSFKQFTDVSKNESLQTIIQAGNTINKQTDVTYKVTISRTQQAGAYHNVVTYILTPNY